ncbi:MAG TPA: helix-turn-helix transcriptional regulator [Tepidisphaeraceae bacterium]|nr:helix-turn-helix transcriptional regulator [Tepidisphaeraceae bacterium]
MKTRIIDRRGKRFALVPLKDFRQLKHDAEMLEDIRAYDAAKAREEEAFPAEIADRLIRGENPIRVLRKYRGLTQQQLAKIAHVARPYLTELETGKKTGSVSVLRMIAAALKVELDDIAA